MSTQDFKRIQTKLSTTDKIMLTKEKQTLLKNLLEGAAHREPLVKKREPVCW